MNSKDQNEWNGVILAGGMGQRLSPLTKAVNKHLLPVFDKPMIFYPLSLLMLLGIRKITIVSNGIGLEQSKLLFGDGSQYGVEIKFVTQKNNNGIVDALNSLNTPKENQNTCVVLGDNIFYGSLLLDQLKAAMSFSTGAAIFCCVVDNPSNYGVVTFDNDGVVTSLVEKPKVPKSNLAIPGIYFLDHNFQRYATGLSQSCRGELEIIDLLEIYRENIKLRCYRLHETTTWIDAGNPDDLLLASNFIQKMQESENRILYCPEEIALNLGLISQKSFNESLAPTASSKYGHYLNSLR